MHVLAFEYRLTAPAAPDKKKRDATTSLSFALGYPDSNQERQDQNLQCYHYTIAQCSFEKRCKYTAFFWFANILAHFLPIIFLSARHLKGGKF